MPKIIIFRPGALGDTLLAFPALAALRRAFPGARLSVIGNAPALALARDAGLVDGVGAFDDLCWAELFTEEGIRSEEGRRALKGADLAVLWLRDSEGLAARSLRAQDIPAIVSAPGRPPEDALAPAVFLERQRTQPAPDLTPPPPAVQALTPPLPAGTPAVHAAEYLLGTLAPVIGADALAGASMPPLMLAPEAQVWAEEERVRRGLTDRPVLAIHPGSGRREKCWPPERFAALAGRFILAGWRVLVIEGVADGEVAPSTLARLPTEAAQAVAGLALPQLAALLARATLFVGNDSGISHLSAMLGAPTLALFGPTNPAIWAPRGPRVRVVWPGAAAPMMALSVDEVYHAAQALLGGEAGG